MVKKTELQKLKDENQKLKDQLEKVVSKKVCYHCHGTGEIWTYWDGDTWCRDCHGSGMI